MCRLSNAIQKINEIGAFSSDMNVVIFMNLFYALWLQLSINGAPAADQILCRDRADKQSEQGYKSSNAGKMFIVDEDFVKPPFVTLEILHLNECCFLPWEKGAWTVTYCRFWIWHSGIKKTEILKMEGKKEKYFEWKWLFDICNIICIQEKKTSS